MMTVMGRWIWGLCRLLLFNPPTWMHPYQSQTHGEQEGATGDATIRLEDPMWVEGVVGKVVAEAGGVTVETVMLGV